MRENVTAREFNQLHTPVVLHAMCTATKKKN